MKTLWSAVIMLCFMHVSSQPITNSIYWEVTNITSDEALSYPYEITYGPDGDLWVTERTNRNGIGKQIIRIGTDGTNKTTMLDLSTIIFSDSGQDGLMGMTVHPALYNDITTTTNNHVFVAYTYNSGGRRLRLARLVYDHVSGTLSPDTSLDAYGTLLDGLPASSDHNAGRMKIGPDLKLYYTMGDQGANQFGNACNPIKSQVLPSSATDFTNYPGKILRLNLDGSVPVDNPIIGGQRTHVYSYGHRNPQGIVFANDGTLFSSEHGDTVDDELNIIDPGKNYGWPEIAGYYDNLAYEYCNKSSGSCSGHHCPWNATVRTEFQSYPNAVDMPADFQEPIGTYNSTIASAPNGGWLQWPTVAPSSIAIYEKGLIPGWERSLLIPTLKKGTIYRAKLNPDGVTIDTSVGNNGYEEWHSSNDRYRDVAIAPDGITFYAITDNTGGTSGPSGTSSVAIDNPGVIVKIEYVGTVLSTSPDFENTFSMYPNPVSKKLHIKFTGNNKASNNVQIVDVNGRVMTTKEMLRPSSHIDVASLSNGLYFVKIKNEMGRVLLKKMVIYN